MAIVEELQEAAARVTARAGDAVVRIGRGWGRGAGVVVADGIIVTNAHNLRGGETTVTFADGRTSTGAVAGVDADGDLAVIKVETSGLSPIPWETGTGAMAVGTPVWGLTALPGGGMRATWGTISALARPFRGPRGRQIPGGLEHTAPLVRGSSGGPVVDSEGRLVGINTHRLERGFYLAVPADAALRERVDALARGESPQRLRLGVAVAPPFAARRLRTAVGLPEREGVLVRGVEEAGPAGRAGLRRGDLIVTAGGRDVRTIDDLYGALDSVAEGASMRLRVVRGADELDVDVSFGEGAPGTDVRA